MMPNHEQQMIWSMPQEAIEAALTRAAHAGALVKGEDLLEWLNASSSGQEELTRLEPVPYMINPLKRSKPITPFVTLRSTARGALAGTMVGEARLYAVSEVVGVNSALPLTRETTDRLRSLHVIAEDQAFTNGIMTEYARARAEKLALQVVPDTHKPFYIAQRIGQLTSLIHEVQLAGRDQGLTMGHKKIVVRELENGIDALGE